MICEPAILSFWKCAYCSRTAVARFRFHWKTTNGFWTNKIRHYIILHHNLSDWVLQSGILAVWGNFWNTFEDKVFFTGVARIFHWVMRGGITCVEQRALQCLPPEYCRFFAKKKARKGRGTPQDPHPLSYAYASAV